MWFDNDLLRTIYLPAVLTSVMFALFSTSLSILDILPEIIGWSFLLIQANLVNDYIDKDRKILLTGKPLLGLSFAFLFFGLYLLSDKFIYAIAFVLLYIIHNYIGHTRKFWDIPLQVIALVVMPYLATVGEIDYKIFSLLIVMGINGMFFDRLMDEKLNKTTFRSLKFVTNISSFALFGLFLYLVSDSYYRFLAPMGVLFLGNILALLRERLSFQTKIAIIYAANAMLFYLVGVLATMGKLV